MATPQATFTLDELLAYLGTRQPVEGYLTHNEWADELGVSRYRMRHIMHEAKARGILRVSKDTREAICGTMKVVPVYRFDLPESGDD